MLVLGRRENERILIGDCIEVVVVSVGHGQVRLGFVAPPDVAIRRDDAKELGPKDRAVND